MSSDGLLQSLVNTCIGRFDRYLVQSKNGKYRPVFEPLTYDVLRDHLGGFCTLATYAITEKNLCRFAVFDADDENGLFRLFELQEMLGVVGVPSYLEESRRGAHLWVFLQSQVSPVLLRRALLPYCPPGVEFFPAQDTASFEHPGYAVRVPLGVHRKSGENYSFVSYRHGLFLSCTSTIDETLHWLSAVERVPPEVIAHLAGVNGQQVVTRPPNVLQKKREPVMRGARDGGQRWATIVEWRAEQDPFVLIGRYVDLDTRGMGCCPFGWHHSDGVDRHPSLWVYRPTRLGGCCWYCHAWKRGGSVFDFLLLYYGLETRELWHRILSGESF
jgi:hypothetical protein